LVNAFVDSNICGTAKQILEKYEGRRAIIGDIRASLTFGYSGMSFDDVKASMTAYATKVMPELRRWPRVGSRRAA
jgi:hypothetical protein